MTLPVLLTAQGTGVDMWTGYPADIARQLESEHLVRWQPIGDWPAATFPMGPSTDAGVRSGVGLINALPAGTPIELLGYSQGGNVVSLILDEFRRAGGALKSREHDLIAGATFGNPMRELAHGGTGGRGISDKLIVATPEFWVDEAAPGDIYTSVPNDAIGADMTAIFKLVQLRGLDDVIGVGSLLPRVMSILTSPLQEFPAVVEAIVKALVFFGGKPMCAAHVEYHIRTTTGGITYYEHAMQHLRARSQYALAA